MTEIPMTTYQILTKNIWNFPSPSPQRLPAGRQGGEGCEA
jgi:hypothetical protein